MIRLKSTVRTPYNTFYGVYYDDIDDYFEKTIPNKLFLKYNNYN